MQSREYNMVEHHTKITAVSQVISAVECAIESGIVAHIIGEPGLGKTQALLYAQSRIHGSIYCSVSQTSKNYVGLLKMLHGELGFLADHKYTRDIENSLLNHLPIYQGRDGDPVRRLVMIDEIQILELPAFRDLLEIATYSPIALVVCGNPTSLASSAKRDAGTFNQIRSRIGLWRHIEKPTAEDCQRIAAGFNLEGMDAYKAAVEIARSSSLRIMCNVLARAENLSAGRGSTKLHHMKTAVLELYGPSKFKSLAIRTENY